MPKVSVIMPVYNAKDYIERCLDSVCNQTLDNIEIICVNDASTDNSIEILKEYAKKYSNLKVIDCAENGGESKARNIGLENATGEYLAFVDNDDTIDLDFYEKLYAKAKETNADIVKGDVKVFNYENKEVKPYFYDMNDKLSMFTDKMFFCMYWWTAIYKRELIINNAIRLPENMILGGDIVFLNNAVEKANKVEVVHNIHYNYYRRENSGDSKTLSLKKIKSVLMAYNEVLNNINKLEDISFEAYNYIYAMFFSGILSSIYRSETFLGKELCADCAYKLYRECKYKLSLEMNLEQSYNKKIVDLLKNQQEKDRLINSVDVYGNTRDKIILNKLRDSIKNKAMKPLISIITVCYNEPNLEETCKSIVNQESQDFEWIVIDGGSNKKTLDIFEKYKSRINYFVSEKDSGIYNAMNKGILASKGEYLLFLNAGDCLFDSQNLKLTTEKFDKNNDVIYCEGTFDIDNKLVSWKIPSKLTEAFFYRSALFHQATFFKRTLFEKYGLYDEKYKIASDWKYCLMLFKSNVHFQYIDKIISRDDCNGISSTNKELSKNERTNILKEFYTDKQLLKLKVQAIRESSKS